MKSDWRYYEIAPDDLTPDNQRVTKRDWFYAPSKEKAYSLAFRAWPSASAVTILGTYGELPEGARLKKTRIARTR